MTAIDIESLYNSVVDCLRRNNAPSTCLEEVTKTFEAYMKPPVMTPPPELVIAEIGISKFTKIRTEDIPWRSGNIYAFPANITLGLTYRWISVRYEGQPLVHEFMLVTPNSVTVGAIRSQIKLMGVWKFCQDNDVGRTFQPLTLDIRPVNGPVYNGIPMAYLSYLASIGQQGAISIALGIIE